MGLGIRLGKTNWNTKLERRCEMAILTSSLFSSADVETKKHLENCATGMPNEQSSHFSATDNAVGQHIQVIQTMLQRVIDRKTDNPPIPNFGSIGNTYTKQFEESIKVFKKNRGLTNYAGVIDGITGKKTIRALDSEADRGRAGPAPSPPTPTPAGPTFASKLSDAIKKASGMTDSAEKVLFWASCSIKDPGANAYNDKALKLVDRCFKINTHIFDASKFNDISRIKQVLRNVATFLPEMGGGSKFTKILPGPKKENGLDVQAEASVGGWKQGNKDGITYYLNMCGDKSVDYLSDITVHESVHFAGGIDHYNIAPGEAAYGPKALKLTNSQALVNASSYAYLAYFAQFPSEKWDAPVDADGNIT
jgi:hypothetical protein